jgi:hypothetical protein
VPSGYLARTDRANAQIADAKYALSGGAWEVRTGPAHIVWAPGDTASGTFTVTSHFDQLEAPAHPEAYGLIFGGRDLNGDGQRYGYFLVRGTGEYLIKVREGATTRTVKDWTASPAVPKQDAQGKASYDLGVRVRGDSVRFLVNGATVAAVARSAVPTDGVAGLRINHNLHVRARPVAIAK